jgi:TatD DNase family protein
MIDSHCHLDHEPLLSNIDNIISRSKEAGITKLLTICTTSESFLKIKEIINKDELIYGSYGIHPHETEQNHINKNDIIENVRENKRIIGIGETGLDFFYNHSNKIRQIESFKEHIEASIELNMPIIIHSRNAESETFEILNDYKGSKLKILMHCFTGSLEFSKQLLSLDSFFSASGIITFKNSNDLRETFKTVPLDRLLIETDSPFLAPVPKRGKKNEPSFIRYTAEKLSELKNISFQDLVKFTTNNFDKLFFNK